MSRNSNPRAMLVGAATVGAVMGFGSVVTTPEQRQQIDGQVHSIAAEVEFFREREPQAGDHWGGCNDARTAGTAPIYAGEPGYREDMDGDGDGIACEPHA